VQFVEVVSALAQWARLSAEIRLNVQRFLTGVEMATKSVHPLQLKRLLLSQLSGTVQSADYLPVAIATIHLAPL
jgi:hypothetical protein